MPSPFFKPIFAGLLALLLALGNIPAWWHCGGCHSEVETDVAIASAPAVGHSAKCCGSRCRAERAMEPEAAILAAEDDDSSHDESTCVTCRAAIAGTASTLEIARSLPAPAVLSFAGLLPAPLLTATQIASARPRGPPVQLA